MSKIEHQDGTDAASIPQDEAPRKPLTPAAQRALAEAEERRRLAEKQAAAEAEQGGPKGLEPTRFGDWERKGITYDF